MDKVLFCQYFLESFEVITSILFFIGWMISLTKEENRAADTIVALFVIVVSFISALALYD